MANIRKALIQVRDSFSKSLGEALATFVWKMLLAAVNFVGLPFVVNFFTKGFGPRFQISLRSWITVSFVCFAFVGTWFFFQWRKERFTLSKSKNTVSSLKLREWSFRIIKQATVPIMVVMICVSLAVSSTLYAVAPEIKVCVIPKTGFSPDDITIIAIREDHTVDRLITNGDGRATIEWIKRAHTKFIAIRFAGEFVEWSEFEWDPSYNEISSLNFPQFRHLREQYEPILFSNTSAELSRKAGESIVAISNDLRGTEDIIALIARASKTPVADPTTYDNYGLSLERGENTRAKFNPALPLPQMIVIPLDYHFPLKDQQGNDLDSSQQRSVIVVPLRRVFDAATSPFRIQKGPDMVFRQIGR